MKVTIEHYAISDSYISVYYTNEHTQLSTTVKFPWDGETLTEEMVLEAIAKRAKKNTAAIKIANPVLHKMNLQEFEIPD